MLWLETSIRDKIRTETNIAYQDAMCAHTIYTREIGFSAPSQIKRYKYAAESKQANVVLIQQGSKVCQYSRCRPHSGSILDTGLVLPHVFEPVRSAILLEKKPFAIREAACDTPFTLG